MGFELELRIGMPRGGGAIRGFWFEEFATIKLGKVCSGKLRALYESRGRCENCPGVQLHTDIDRDKYGKKLGPISIAEVVGAIASDIRMQDYCSRYYWALALLREMEKDEIEGLSVLLYGY